MLLHLTTRNDGDKTEYALKLMFYKWLHIVCQTQMKRCGGTHLKYKLAIMLNLPFQNLALIKRHLKSCYTIYCLCCFDSGPRILSLVPHQRCQARRRLPSVHHGFGHRRPWCLCIDCGMHFSWTDRSHQEEGKHTLIPECTSAFLMNWFRNWHVEELSKKQREVLQ